MRGGALRSGDDVGEEVGKVSCNIYKQKGQFWVTQLFLSFVHFSCVSTFLPIECPKYCEITTFFMNIFTNIFTQCLDSVSIFNALDRTGSIPSPMTVVVSLNKGKFMCRSQNRVPVTTIVSTSWTCRVTDWHGATKTATRSCLVAFHWSPALRRLVSDSLQISGRRWLAWSIN